MKRKYFALPVAVAALAAGLVLAVGASGQSLSGSLFEIDDVGGPNGANFIVNTAGNLDWANVVQNRRADAPTGTNDDSYAGGTKEDSVCPGEVTGSIPNNKSDLLEFGGYSESEVNGPGWLHVYWARVNNPSGTTNMDFEFNRSTVHCGSGPNIVRTAGDVLLQFDVDQGGANATLSRRTWSGSAWGPATPLGSTEAIGSINQVTIPANQTDGVSTTPMAPRTFGEASFDLSAVTGGDTCLAFGSAMLKSRSSDSFTSQLKDFIRPISLSNNNCGAVKISKTRKHAADGAGDHPHQGVTFTINGTTVSGVTDANGEVCFDGLALGDQITIDETVPTGYTSDDASQDVTPNNAASCDDATYVGETLDFHNTPRTDVTITVTSQVTGGTSNTVDCDNDALDDGDGGNVSQTETNLLPQEIHCTIVIDP